MKKISVLGSTGSIGTQTLDVVRRNGDIKITALAAGSSVDKTEAQAREFKPALVCMFDETAARDLKIKLADTDIKVVSGMDGLISAAADTDADTVLTAVVGMVGICPTLAAIMAGKDVALANKETLVTAGHLITEAASAKGVRILPVDSEHSAIFQCLQDKTQGQAEGAAVPGATSNKIEKILLTCSGGPFRGRTLEQLRNVTPADALKHPSWNMGRKITIDSSTLVNKGLEVMEAGWLFGVPLDDIQVVVQPGSVVHSMVQFADGAVMAQLGTPDMRLPIQYALYYPERRALPGERLDFAALSDIHFEKPDMVNFPALALAYEAGKTGGSLPTVYNAANEWAVKGFLDGKIGYTDIAGSIEKAMAMHRVISNPSLDEILQTEQEVYSFLSNTDR